MAAHHGKLEPNCQACKEILSKSPADIVTVVKSLLHMSRDPGTSQR
jgi:hypothetical protein